MNDLFNTPFETGLRAMLILSLIKSNGITIDRISAYDFMTTYGKNFTISQQNLHGDNSYSFSELSSKRAVFSEGIKVLVLDGLIAVNRTDKGFLYKLTGNGRKYIQALESDYKSQYIAIAEKVHNRYARKSDSAILKEINDIAVKSLRR
ncbi:MAG: hypothetical protein E7493_09710 [Ruminococcus albus]|nr:hypothetical protein [Ruminococcus albus]